MPLFFMSDTWEDQRIPPRINLMKTLLRRLGGHLLVSGHGPSYPKNCFLKFSQLLCPCLLSPPPFVYYKIFKGNLLAILLLFNPTFEEYIWKLLEKNTSIKLELQKIVIVSLLSPWMLYVLYLFFTHRRQSYNQRTLRYHV
jgi:hypothetical protein